MIVPVPTPESLDKGATETDEDEDRQEFLSAAVSWRDHIDPDEFMRKVRAGRSSTRLSVMFFNFGE